MITPDSQTLRRFLRPLARPGLRQRAREAGGFRAAESIKRIFVFKLILLALAACAALQTPAAPDPAPTPAAMPNPA